MKGPGACQCYIFVAFFVFLSVLYTSLLLLLLLLLTPAVHILTTCLFKSTALVLSSALCVLVGMGVTDH